MNSNETTKGRESTSSDIMPPCFWERVSKENKINFKSLMSLSLRKLVVDRVFKYTLFPLGWRKI
jgi:hypothetical protein